MWSKQVKGSVTVLVFIMLGLVIGMYLMGYSSPMLTFVQEDVYRTDNSGEYTINQEFNISVLINRIYNSLTSEAGLAIFGISIGMAILVALAPGLGYASGSILSVLIPAFLLFLFANIFFFPVIGEPERQGLPSELSWILVAVFNVLLLLTVLTFITGRE
jgi:hypothetical protein